MVSLGSKHIGYVCGPMIWALHRQTVTVIQIDPTSQCKGIWAVYVNTTGFKIKRRSLNVYYKTKSDGSQIFA